MMADDRILLASNNGLFEVNISAKSVTYKQLLHSVVFSFAQSSKQKLWLATKEGVIVYDPIKRSSQQITERLIKDNNFAIGDKIVTDKTGLVWITGQQNKVAIMTGQANFLKDVLSVQAPYFLHEQNTWSIYSEQHIVYAGINNQITVIDRNAHSSVLIEINGLEPSETIYEIKALNTHNLLLATTDGLFIFNKQTHNSTPLGEWTGSEESLSGTVIYQSAYESHSQQWWFATSDGVYRWRTRSKEINYVDIGLNDAQGFRSVFVDEKGRLWVGGENTFGYYENGAFTEFDKTLFGKNVLPIISHITQIDESRFWFGSTFHGIFEYDSMSKRITIIDSLVGPACKTTYFFQKVINEQYIGCRNGTLIRYNKLSDEFEAFDANDGFITNEFNEGAVFYQPQVGLFIGTPSGIMQIDVSRLSHRVADDGVFVASTAAYYPEQSELSLLPQQNAMFKPGAGLVNFQIASHNYLDNQLNEVSYRLLGNNIPKQSDFIRISSSAKINLSNLEAGNYILQLVSEGTQQNAENPYQFHFKISQLWWQSKQFKTLLAFFIFLIGVLTVLRHQSQTQKFKQLNTQLLETQDRLQQALRSSDSDLWEWHTAEAQLHIGNYSKIFSQGKESQIYDMEQLKIHPDDQEYVLEKWNEMIAGKVEAFDLEYRQMSFDGDWRWIRTKGRPVKYNADKTSVETVSGIYTDVTSTRNLEEQASLLAEAFANTSEGVIIFNEKEICIVANRAAQQLLELTLDAIEQQTFSSVFSGVNISITTLLKAKNNWSGELEIVAATGSVYPVWLTLSKMQYKTKDIQKYVAVFSDISQRKSAEEKLRRLANYDPLTGLANRTLFSEKLLNSIQQAQSANTRLALMFMDLDRFKNINDSYGHNMGDALLIEAASRIQQAIGEDAVLSRFGGDEFVLLVSGISTISEVDVIAQKIHCCIEAPFKLFEREFFISTSIGVSLWPDHALKPEALIKNADLAMYHAKEDGPGNVRYFSTARNEKNLYFLRIESELRKAIQKNQFELHYQPQISILDGDKLVGMEVLLRWKHPEDGFIRPDIFIEVAESAGLIIEIDRWVFNSACKQISQWKKQYSNDFKVSINVSAAHFLQPDYVDSIKKVMIQTGVEGKYIGLEITEGVLMKEVDLAQQHLSQLQLLGISIAIDDFGTGYSSLAYLRNFAVNTLKIDRKFIIDITQNHADQAIVTSIIELARNLRLNVVAEGVETYDQMEHLIGRGCYLMQGFYFSKPLSLPNMEDYLEHHFYLAVEEDLV